MNRKWTVVQVVAAVLLLLLMLGCAKKPPATPTTEPDIASPPPTEVTAPAEPSTAEDRTPDPLAGDLRDVNAYAARQGLLGDIYFDFDKYNLKPEARDRLSKNAQFLNSHREFTLTIEGHCDERGTNEYNIGLGERRGNGAKAYLVSLGVSASRLKIISYGEERPQCSEHSEKCWWRNRRAHFLVTGRS